jgi:hypothetical protein
MRENARPPLRRGGLIKKKAKDRSKKVPTNYFDPRVNNSETLRLARDFS